MKENGSSSRLISRRRLLQSAAVLSAATPLVWQATAADATPAAVSQWLMFGADPSSQLIACWLTGYSTWAMPRLPAPQVRWGTTAAYGNIAKAQTSGTVPLPSAGVGEPAEDTVYSSALMSGLAPGTTYHYAVSNDGITWSADSTFTTASAAPSNFRFTAFGDQAASTTAAAPMMAVAASFAPLFHVVPGDLAYATADGEQYPDMTGFNPAQWEKYLKMIGPSGARSIPWQASVGAHEVEPLGDFGYAGVVTRFPRPYDATSGSPVVFSYRVGNVAFVHLDGNDVSAQETVNTGYTKGAQTAWLATTLAAYRSAGSVDFIVVVVNCCCYSSNTNHGSDGGLRDAWGPIFDANQVDLVISGHVHAYERTNPIRGAKVTRHVAVGGTVNPVTDGTTYICAGGGGNGLYPSWYGTTDSGAAGSTTPPKVWRWSGGDTASGGSGTPLDYTDTVTGYSAHRQAVWHCLVVDVTAPTAANRTTTLQVHTVAPTQTATAVTSTASPTVIDSVTLTRTTVLPNAGQARS